MSLRKEPKQAVVPVNIIDEEPCVPTYEKIVEYSSNRTDTVITIQLNSFTVYIKNNVSSSVIHSTIQALRLLCSVIYLRYRKLNCPWCNTQMKPIGKETVREVLQYIPEQLKLLRYIRYSYECPTCRKD